MTRTGGIQSDYRKSFKKQEHPDAKKHQIVSFVKSGVRIIGYMFIPFDLGAAVALLVVSEGIGILEEMV